MMTEASRGMPSISSHMPAKILGASRANFDRRSVGHGAPDLVNLFVSHGDAAVGPILQAMRSPHESITIGQAVEKYVAARGKSFLSRRGSLLRRGIGNVNRFIELAVGVARIENV